MNPRTQAGGVPADERMRPTSSEVTVGLAGQGGPERATQREADDVLNRSAEERYDTPRRYEEDSADE